MASIRDVAKKANVGAATVSRVLNNSGYVSEETRQKIEDAMKELNYTPNELARQLFHKKTGIVAVLVPTVGHPFFSDFVDKIEEELYKKGYKTMVCNTIKEGNAELDYLDMLNRHIVDGVISGVHTLEEEEYVVRNILQENDTYDGVFGVDLAAILYMNEAKKREMKIPDDVRIVSYDGTVITRLTSPLMTSIVQPVSELASESVRLIDEMINGKKYQNKKIVLDVSIQNGNTTKDC